MAEKHSIKVMVVGKELVVKGYETEEYMMRVASYINNMTDGVDKIADFRHLDPEIKFRMLMLNLANDYFKEKQHTEDADRNMKEKLNELDEVKHELVNKGVIVDDLKTKLAAQDNQMRNQEKTIFELQTEIKSLKKEIERMREEGKRS